MVINNDIITAFIYCDYKAYLKGQNIQCSKSEFEIITCKLKEIQKQKYNTKNSITKEFTNQPYDLKNNFQLGKIYTDTLFKNDNINIAIDGCYFNENKLHPILISPFEKITKADKLIIGIQSHFIEKEFNLKIDSAIVVFGEQQKITKVKLATFSKEIKKTILLLNKTLENKTPPIFHKNPHCQICEFAQSCLNKLSERDDLSLLGNFKPKEIEQQNNRGIFSVKQLSYTFRPKKNPYRRRKFLPELKALAIREEKIFIQKLPELEKKEVEIFFDIESIPDKDFYYLIGVIVKTETTQTEHSFWANGITEQQDIFIRFIELIIAQRDFVVYHYGSYEVQVLKRISKKLPQQYQNKINLIIDNSFNILTLISNDIYTPTYTNGLKDIANYLDFKWSDEKASGLQSIVWRYNWELNPDTKLKEQLITYNIEDCRALIKVQDWLTKTFDISNEQFQRVENIKNDSYHKWGNTKFELPVFNQINGYAHFDYQQQKIFLKSNRNVKNALKKKFLDTANKNKIDKVIHLFPKTCPSCNQITNNFTLIKRGELLTIDIKPTKNGIRKMITLYKGGQYKCCHCRKVFSPQKLKKGPLYKHNLIAWAINLQIKYNISNAKVVEIIRDSFNINVSVTKMWEFKSYMANKYKETYEEIISNVVTGNLLHIDETKSSIKDVPSGYVWVFTNMDSVFYLFRKNREADFLKDMLRNFKGVLVSDFYTGYDAIPYPQQRCLIHLIRDLNSDLLKNQFNIEFKNFVSNFGELLQKIIGTVNQYGLKKRNLNKHNKDVKRFYSNFVDKSSEDELLLSYQIRFRKNKDKLFTFLNYNDIPWNNNNAEHAIKPFAYYRRDNEKQITESGINDYLILLSIQQTCKYKGTNFFDFLKSGMKSIYNFSDEQ